jgi:hypothetical protein
MGFTQRRQDRENGRGTTPLHMPSIQLNSIQIDPSLSSKFLGVTFDQKLR